MRFGPYTQKKKKQYKTKKPKQIYKYTYTYIHIYNTEYTDSKRKKKFAKLNIYSV